MLRSCIRPAILVVACLVPGSFAAAQLSLPEPGGPVVPNSPAVVQQLQPSNPATSGSGLPPAPLSARISLSPDTLPIEIGRGPKLGRYYLNRAEEDFSYLSDPARRSDVFDPLKLVRLSDDGRLSLTFSGEERLRNETYTKSGFSFVPPQHQDVLLLRHMYGMDVRAGSDARVFVQLASGQEGGTNYGFAPGVNRDNLQLHQGFAEFGTTLDAARLSARAGRQEFVLGSGAVFSTRETTNIPLSFDGVRGTVATAATRIDGFGFNTVINRAGELQDSSNAHQQFYGVYASQVLPVTRVFGRDDRLFADGFVVGYDSRNSTSLGFTGSEHRNTFGGRLWGQIGSMDLDWNGAVQTGQQGPASVSAFSFFSNTGYTFDAPLQPRIGVRFDVASGGRDGANRLHTYNPLFPQLNTFTESSTLNPVNLYDTGIGLSFSPARRVRVLVYDTVYWRYAQNDGVYGAQNVPYRNTTRVRGTAIGQQPAIRTAYVANDHVTLSAAVAFFRVDGALRDAGAKNNLYTLQQVQFRF